MSNRYAIIKDGIVENIVMAEDDYAQSQGWIICPDNHDTNEGVGPGDSYDGNTGQFSPAQNSLDLLWRTIRSDRDRLLSKSDILVSPDRWESYTTEQKTIISTYRQTLRDIPQNFSDPHKVIWPTPPI